MEVMVWIQYLESLENYYSHIYYNTDQACKDLLISRMPRELVAGWVDFQKHMETSANKPEDR
jgi:hypothetical protein